MGSGAAGRSTGGMIVRDLGATSTHFGDGTSIDEFATMNIVLFACVVARLIEAHTSKATRAEVDNAVSFPQHKRIVMFGDMLQMPPVVTDRSVAPLSMHMVRVLMHVPDAWCAVLHKVYRITHDGYRDFVADLARGTMRAGDKDATIVTAGGGACIEKALPSFVRDRVTTDDAVAVKFVLDSYKEGGALIAATNETAERFNDRALRAMRGPGVHEYHCFDGVHLRAAKSGADATKSLGMQALEAELLTSCITKRLPPMQLKLRVGCPVVVLRNLDRNHGLLNGTRHYFRGVVRTHDNGPVTALLLGPRHDSPVHEYVPLPRTLVGVTLGHGQELLRKQFCIRLAFADTVHAFQGATMKVSPVWPQRRVAVCRCAPWTSGSRWASTGGPTSRSAAWPHLQVCCCWQARTWCRRRRQRGCRCASRRSRIANWWRRCRRSTC